MEDHPEIWKRRQHWFGNLDRWVTKHGSLAPELGGWKRASHDRFDLDSPSYQDMVFFHPFVRRVFFDTGNHDRDDEAKIWISRKLSGSTR